VPDVALLAARRAVLPYTTAAGDTVAVHNNVIYLNGQPRSRTEALDLSAALARAVNDTHPNHSKGA
jgi:hypothetical protein